MVGGKLILPKQTKAEVLKDSAKSLAAKLIATDDKVDMVARTLSALINAVLVLGMDVKVLAAEAKKLGLDLRLADDKAEEKATPPAECDAPGERDAE